MSADNGLIINKGEHGYLLVHYDASSGEPYWEKKFKTEKGAVKYAREYMREEVVEYGLEFGY